MSRRILPWPKRAEKEPLDFHIFKLRQLTVEDPRNGSLHPRVLLECPDWVNVVALTEASELILIRQFRFGTWSNTLEIPGGMVDPGEGPEAAAARELIEETGYQAKSVSLLGSSHPNPAIQGNRLHSYLATGCVKVHDGAFDEGEDIAIELYPKDELGRLVRSGEISHALVLTALHYWSLHGA